ncbi:MAG: hypothetical protein H6Q72_1908 [Firmicutes bacterium]|nr:hypothetical protein [Bacillota bacterium]
MKIFQYAALENTQNEERAVIKYSGNQLTIEVYKKTYSNNEATGGMVCTGESLAATASIDVAENTYSSQLFVVAEAGQVGQFVPVHHFTYSSRSPLNIFQNLLLNPQLRGYFQIDIGGYGQDMENKLILKTFHIPIRNIVFEGFNNVEQVVTQEMIVPTRYEVWDTYSLACNQQEAGCKDSGEVAFGEELVISPGSEDYVEFTIQKYSPQFGEKLNREIDNEEVFVESTAGVVNTTRVQLQEGQGKFRLYPFGYTGKCKLKLGWRYYAGWCEYPVTIA